MKDKKLIRKSQQGFTRCKSCFTNLIHFYDEMTSCMDQGRPVDMIHLGFHKVFATISHNTDLEAEKLWAGWTVRYVENWLDIGLISQWLKVQLAVNNTKRITEVLLGLTSFLIFISNLDYVEDRTYQKM